MKTRLVFALSGMLIAGIVGCDKPVNPKVESFIYPLAMDNSWGYDYQEIIDYRGTRTDDTLRYSIIATVVRIDTILPGIYSYTIRETSAAIGWPEPPPELSYANLPDGMYRLRPDGQSSLALPKQRAGVPGVIFRGRRYKDTRTLIASLIDPAGMTSAVRSGLFDPLPLVLPYPQRLQQRWTYRAIGIGQGLGVDKQIVAFETAKTSAGSFGCHVIQWIYEPPLEGVDVVEFISAEGLIQRRVEVHDLVIPDYEHPYGGDTANAVTTYELTSVKLN